MNFNHYRQFEKEVHGMEVESDASGFITFLIDPPNCIVKTMFIAPEHRGKEMFRTLVDRVVSIAKDAGCNYLTSQIELSNPLKSSSTTMHIKYGMKMIAANNNVIVWSKEI